MRVSGRSGSVLGGLATMATVVTIAVAIVWLLAYSPTRERPTAEVPAKAPLPKLAPVVPTADTAALFGTPGWVPRVGRRVRATAVTVQSVVGDGVFWVGPSLAQRLLVVRPLDESSSSPVHANVEAGETIDVSGTLRSMPDAFDAWRRLYGLRPAAIPGLRDANVYLKADSVVSGRSRE